MIDQALAVNDVSLSEIIHIGDNPRADAWGATRVGIGSLLVNSNQTSILTLKNHALQNILTA
jgi:putative hydrolase of the HAD superfamily